jgi:iron complex outermembrane receptor protein
MSQSRDKAYWIVAIAALATFGGMMSARAQDGSPGASGYVEAIEDPDIIGGTDAEQVDSQEVQAQEALDGRSVENVSRFRSNQVEEIVVQARKRAELLEDTPVSVTALSENTLREAGITRLDQIQDLVPNLQVAGGLSGQDVQLRIRGVGTDRADLAFDPGVGVYVDGVFLPRAQGNFLDVLDVAQIEVLRGPQGTLFGKNTVGGAINMTTVKPGPDPEAFAFVRTGNFGTAVSRLSLNMPVDIGWFEDKLFSRLTVGTNNRRGYVYNALRDEYWSDSNSVTFLGSLRFIPVPELTIDLSGTWSNEHTHAMAGRCIPVREDAPLSGPTLFDACKKSNQPFRIEADTAQIQAIESYGTWMTATYDLPDLGWFEGLALKNLTSWREQIPRRRADVDNTSIPAVDLESLGGQSWARNGEPGRAQQISTELQLTGEVAQRLNFIAGYFVFWENADEYLSTLVQSPLGAPLPPPVGQIYLRRTTRRNTSIDNWTWALFTQATYDVFDWMSITGGVRYTEDKKGLSYDEWEFAETPNNIPPECQPGPSNPQCREPVVGDPTTVRSGSKIFTAWTPMGTLQLTTPADLLVDTPLDHLMGYFQYSRGFKGGGWNALTGGAQPGALDPFDPETLDNFEFGLKTIWLDQRLLMNISLFMGKYEDIQVTSNRTIYENDDPDNPRVITLVQNAAEATTKGIEWEFILRPGEGWVINGSIGYLDSEYDSFPGSPSDYDTSFIDRTGEQVRGVPELQTFLAAQYSHPIDFGGPAWLEGWITPRAEWAYTSEIYFVGPEVPQGRQPGWNILNLRLSYSFLDDNAEFALWSKNTLNSAYFQWASPIVNTFGVLGAYYAAPRTFGAEFSYRY